MSAVRKKLVLRNSGDVYLIAAISNKPSSDIPDSILVEMPTGVHFIQEDEPVLLAETMNHFFEGVASSSGGGR